MYVLASPDEVIGWSDPYDIELPESAGGGMAGENDFGISVGGNVVTSGATLPYDANVALVINETLLDGYEFVSITDKGDPLQALPHSNYFRESFLNPSDVGGRYSALTYVGLVPAALLWLDLDPLLEDARIMAEATKADADDNPALVLGAGWVGLAPPHWPLSQESSRPSTTQGEPSVMSPTLVQLSSYGAGP